MAVPYSLIPRAGWLHQVGARVATYWFAKMLCTTLGMTAFFWVYFWLLRNPHFPPTFMPLMAVDRWIGFLPETLPLYLSLWVYVSLAPALLIDRRELLSYGLATAALSAMGLTIFYCWPTAVPPPDVDWSQHTAFAFLKSVDASGNACPSLHVAFAVFTAIWFERILKQMALGRLLRALNGLWCLGILFSTVAIRQHVSLDVLAGAALGATVAIAHLRWLRAFPGTAAIEPKILN